MKIAVITSHIGLHNPLRDPEIKFEGVDYFAFVDRQHDCKIWKQIPHIDFSLDEEYKSRRNAKIYKVLPNLFFPNYDYWFWMDTTHDLIMDPSEVIKNYMGDSEIGLWVHTSRNCAYQEGEEIKRLKYDHINLVDNQLNYYRSQGFPENYGLFELPVSIRKNTHNVQKLNLRWWDQISRYSSRDQISMPFVIWRTGVDIKILPGFSNGGLGKNPIMPQVRIKGQ